MRSVEHIKRYTSISTANDQGKTSGVNAIGVIAAALRTAGEASRGIGDIGTTTYRAPFTPVAFAALAGRQRGELFDPARVTSIHPWHVAKGALFEDVGQWKRPWYYPQAGEDMDAAVLRECAADAKRDHETPDVVKERLSSMLEFVEEVSGWYEQVRSMPRPTLLKLMRMGSRVAKIVG